MTQEELETLEYAMFWIQADANRYDSKSTADEARDLADKIWDIIQKYRNKVVPYEGVRE